MKRARGNSEPTSEVESAAVGSAKVTESSRSDEPGEEIPGSRVELEVDFDDLDASLHAHW
jgi:hypothetical protein